MSENIVMCKITHFCTVLCAIFINFVSNFYLFTKYKIVDAKIAHSLSKSYVIFGFFPLCKIAYKAALTLPLGYFPA